MLKVLTFSSRQALNCAEYSSYLTVHSLLPLSLSLKPFPHLQSQLIITLLILLRKLKQSVENMQGLPPSHLPTSIYTHICCFLDYLQMNYLCFCLKPFFLFALDSILPHLKNFAKSPPRASFVFFTFGWIIPIKSMLCFLPSEGKKKTHKNLFMCFNRLF